MGDNEGSFGDKGYIEGAGKAGQATEDWAMDIMKDPTNEKMVMFYGISSICVAVVTLILYLTLNSVSNWEVRNTVLGTYWGFIIH